ncbi:MAG: hypothetical protein IKW57_04215 [Alphaproteobacteria bacterium]|nr:hypothetical protein [Alphaproteobacteria bacterium]
MSCQVHVFVVCENCGHKHEAILDSRINGSVMEDTQKIGTDTLNMVTCPNCGFESRAKFPVLYENFYTKTVVWYRPCKGTDDFFEMVEDFYINNRAEAYKKNLLHIKTWKKFKEIFSKDILKNSMDMAFDTSSGEEMGKELSKRRMASLLLELGTAKLLKEHTNLLLDVPEFTLQESSCIYTGHSETPESAQVLKFVAVIVLILFAIVILAAL